MQKRKSPESVFMRRTNDIYHGQAKRFAEKRGKNNRLVRAGRAIPYTLAELREWVKRHFTLAWVTACGYCERSVTLEDFKLDHEVPTTRGGALDLDNQVLCCDECNRIKGKLTGSEYRQFRKGMETFPEAARKDVYHRMKTGAGFVRLRFFKRTTQPQPAADADF